MKSGILLLLFETHRVLFKYENFNCPVLLFSFFIFTKWEASGGELWHHLRHDGPVSLCSLMIHNSEFPTAWSLLNLERLLQRLPRLCAILTCVAGSALVLISAAPSLCISSGTFSLGCGLFLQSDPSTLFDNLVLLSIAQTFTLHACPLWCLPNYSKLLICFLLHHFPLLLNYFLTLSFWTLKGVLSDKSCSPG